MSRYNTFVYNDDFYGMPYLSPKFYKRCFHRIPLGTIVHRDVGKKITFQARTGNGYFGSILGKLYYDKYFYNVPSSINNAQGEPYRRQFIAAIEKWQYDLTTEQKALYNKRATKGLRMSGYNLFIRKAMKGEIEMYVDRGDPAAVDYEKEDLTIDGAWHELDLSAIVPAGAKAVLFASRCEGNAVNWKICIRKKGNTNTVNQACLETIRANVTRYRTGTVAVDVNRKVEYNADNQAWTTLSLTVRGWWT